MNKKHIFFVLILITVGTVLGCAVDEPYARPLFDTPEQAVEAFIEAIKQNDYDAAMSTYPIYNMAAGYDFVANVDSGYLVNCIVAPSNSDYYINANIDYGKGRFAFQILYFCRSFLAYEDETTIIEDTNPQKLSTITIKSIDKPVQLDSKEAIELFSTQAAILGADEITERITLLEYDGKSYLAGFSLIKYDDNWGIKLLTSKLSDKSAFGRLSEISADEYNILTE